MPKASYPGPLIGYARVSTQGQDLAQQRALLREAGCARIFEKKDQWSETQPAGAGEAARSSAGGRRGDGNTPRSPRPVHSRPAGIAERIKEAGAGLRSLAEPWADTTTPAGRMVLTVFAGIVDFERSLIVERTNTGRIAAKARGVRFGPRPSLSAEQIAHARQLTVQEGKPVVEVARLFRVHRATLYRALAAEDV